MSRVLTPEEAMRAKELYEQKDAYGRRKLSQMKIARMLGVSETTIFRIVNRAGGYRDLKELPKEEDVLASQERVMKGLAERNELRERADGTIELIPKEGVQQAQAPDLWGPNGWMARKIQEVPDIPTRKPPVNPMEEMLEEEKKEEESEMMKRARILGARV